MTLHLEQFLPVITAATAYGITDQSCASFAVYPRPTIIEGSYNLGLAWVPG